jgi:hypothetical protein
LLLPSPTSKNIYHLLRHDPLYLKKTENKVP